MVRRAQRDERTELRGRELIFRAPDCSELVQPSRALNQLYFCSSHGVTRMLTPGLSIDRASRQSESGLNWWRWRRRREHGAGVPLP
jgi:hypothetical protein